MSKIKNKLIKIAYENPELRDEVLNILKQSSQENLTELRQYLKTDFLEEFKRFAEMELLASIAKNKERIQSKSGSAITFADLTLEFHDFTGIDILTEVNNIWSDYFDELKVIAKNQKVFEGKEVKIAAQIVSRSNKTVVQVYYIWES